MVPPWSTLWASRTWEIKVGRLRLDALPLEATNLRIVSGRVAASEGNAMAREVKRTLATKETDHDDPGEDAVHHLEPRRPDRGHAGVPVRTGAGGACAADRGAAG